MYYCIGTLCPACYTEYLSPTLHDRVVRRYIGVTLMGMIDCHGTDTSYLLVVIMLIGMIGFIAIGFEFLEKV